MQAFLSFLLILLFATNYSLGQDTLTLQATDTIVDPILMMNQDTIGIDTVDFVEDAEDPEVIEPDSIKPYSYPEHNFFVNLSICGAFPESIYADHMNNNGIGIGFGFYYQVKKDIPLYLGFSGAYIRFDRLEFNFDGYPTEVTRTNQFLWLAHARYLQPVPWNWVQPYAEASFGVKTLATRTAIGESDEEDTRYERHSRDFTYAFGLGGGLMITLARGLTADIQLAYLLGGFAIYHSLPENVDPSQYDYGIDAFTLNHSITDILMLRVGVSALVF